MFFLGQMGLVLLEDPFVFRVGGQVLPFVRILAQVVEFAGSVEILIKR